ncbi:MAG: hypothetical protein HQ510_03565 [Candidatus Marinimicrobia bacterium]|nr:hypothetical protein [Candidatus Neomarinimicrobiota bacterium]
MRVFIIHGLIGFLGGVLIFLLLTYLFELTYDVASPPIFFGLICGILAGMFGDKVWKSITKTFKK